jgi:hypothetical protein
LRGPNKKVPSFIKVAVLNFRAARRRASDHRLLTRRAWGKLSIENQAVARLQIKRTNGAVLCISDTPWFAQTLLVSERQFVICEVATYELALGREVAILIIQTSD